MSGTATATAGPESATATSQFTPGSTTNPDVTRLDDTTASNVTDDPIDVEDFLGTPTFAQLLASFGAGYSFTPPTGQVTSFRTLDDPDVEASIFTDAVRRAESLKIRNTLIDFDTLGNNSTAGTTARFTSEALNQTYTNNLIIDHYTGLMWYRVVQGTDVWNDAIDNAAASTQGGFSNWFLPNIRMLGQLIDESNTGSSGMNYAPFNITTTRLLSSTTTAGTTTSSMFKTTVHGIATNSKTTVRNYIFVRKHF